MATKRSKLNAAELLAHNLRRLMDERGMSEAQLATAAGLPGKPYVAAMNLRGDYLTTDSPKWPQGKRLDALARALDVPRSELLRELELELEHDQPKDDTP